MPFISHRFLSTLVVLALTLSITAPAVATIDVYAFDSEQQEQQFRGLTKDLRCPKCQNQSISDSDAPIAQDMRAQVADMVREGHTDEEVVTYFVDRYGDFVSYKPPVKAETILLWLLPIIAVLWGIWLVIRLIRKAASLPQEDEQEQQQ
jgi:cytochrome c-type biogenesis protein CcmH